MKLVELDGELYCLFSQTGLSQLFIAFWREIRISPFQETSLVVHCPLINFIAFFLPLLFFILFHIHNVIDLSKFSPFIHV